MGSSDGPVLDRVLDLVADESPSRFDWSFLAGAEVRERNRLGVCCLQVILQQVAVQHCNTENGCSSETTLPDVASAACQSKRPLQSMRWASRQHSEKHEPLLEGKFLFSRQLKGCVGLAGGHAADGGGGPESGRGWSHSQKWAEP